MQSTDENHTITPDYRTLESARDALLAKCDELLAKCDEHQSKYEAVKHELDQLKRLVFGVRSEKRHFIPPNQASLFDLPEETTLEPETETVNYTRTKPSKDKQKPVRTEIPGHLPRVEEVIEPDPIPENGERIGEEITEILEYEPGKMYVRRIVRPKYAANEKGVTCAEMPTLPLPYCNAGPGLLAHLWVSKYVDHLPVYRLCGIFERHGVKLAESTVSGWFNKTCRLVEPVYEVMKKTLLTTAYLMADETPIKVLDKTKKRSTHRGYFWVYCTPQNKLAVFDYQKGRGREGPNEFLRDFTGILQSDGYKVYDILDDANRFTGAACMAHVRRKFHDAKEQAPAQCEKALNIVGQLYKIEKSIRLDGLDDDEILKRRKESQKILRLFKEWLDEIAATSLPKSGIGKAVTYAQNQWGKLMTYTKHPHVHIDNNLVENTIRPVALGRKNYLFAGSHRAAQDAAMMYSFFATCKMNDVDPYAWLNHVLRHLPDTKIGDIESLFPQNVKLD